MKVCVIGWGAAGAEAAAEAGRAGAEVTILEKSERLGPHWRTWPDLIAPPERRGGGGAPPRRPRAEDCLKVLGEAKGAGQGLVTTTDGRKVTAEAVIVATGTRFEHVHFAGVRKQGVTELDGWEKYLELGRSAPSVSRFAVVGEGERSLEIADRLSGGGRKIALIASCWQHWEPSSALFRVLSEAAAARGIRVTAGPLSKAVGTGLLEGMVAGGRVIRVDRLILAPKRLPRALPLGVPLGRSGGIPVDILLRTRAPGVFAAGGCAELMPSSQTSTTLDAAAQASGRVAGANSTGENIAFTPAGSSVVSLFGLRWTRAGRTPAHCLASGREVGTVSNRPDSTSVCTIAFDRGTGRVLGIETLERSSVPPAAALSSLSPGVTLKAIAYGGEWSSSDISLVSDTARLGLRIWSRSSSATRSMSSSFLSARRLA
jgi:pyruvate/2-oxoglutarate dehydrogenase complex dihydrolipoamide dehydrogenase (E3) component